MVATSHLDPWISLVSFPPPQEGSRSESQQLLADLPCSEVGKTQLLCVPRSPLYARHHMGKHCSSHLTDQKAEIQRGRHESWEGSAELERDEAGSHAGHNDNRAHAHCRLTLMKACIACGHLWLIQVLWLTWPGHQWLFSLLSSFTFPIWF